MLTKLVGRTTVLTWLFTLLLKHLIYIYCINMFDFVTLLPKVFQMNTKCLIYLINIFSPVIPRSLAIPFQDFIIWNLSLVVKEHRISIIEMFLIHLRCGSFLWFFWILGIAFRRLHVCFRLSPPHTGIFSGLFGIGARTKYAFRLTFESGAICAPSEHPISKCVEGSAPSNYNVFWVFVFWCLITFSDYFFYEPINMRGSILTNNYTTNISNRSLGFILKE